MERSKKIRLLSSVGLISIHLLESCRFQSPPPKYFITFDRTYWNHILGFEVWASLSLKWWKTKKSDEPFFRNWTFDFLTILSWFSLKGPIRIFCFQSIIALGGPNFETYYMASIGTVENVNFFRGRGVLKNADFAKNGQKPKRTRYSSMSNQSTTGFWSPFLSRTFPSYHTHCRYEVNDHSSS